LQANSLPVKRNEVASSPALIAANIDLPKLIQWGKKAGIEYALMSGWGRKHECS